MATRTWPSGYWKQRLGGTWIPVGSHPSLSPLSALLLLLAPLEHMVRYGDTLPPLAWFTEGGLINPLSEGWTWRYAPMEFSRDSDGDHGWALLAA